IGLEAYPVQESGHAACEKIEIFEEAKIAEVGGDSEREHQAPGACGLRSSEEPSDGVIADGRHRQQRHEAPVPPAVKHVACDESDQRLKAAAGQKEGGEEQGR